MRDKITEEPLSENILRERSVGLFTYLKKLAQLRGKPTREVGQYTRVLWFSTVPKEPECFTPAWDMVKKGHEEIWLQIKRPRFSEPPPVPAKVKLWVNENQLHDSSNIPELRPRILDVEQESNHSSSEEQLENGPIFLELSDFPDVVRDWEKYLDAKWLSWAEENERLKSIHEVYSKLHEIYQLLKASGERYQLDLGLGLLTWRTTANQLVQHPLLIAQASIELDPKRGTLYVKQGVEGAKLTLEEEMLEVSERCNIETHEHIQQLIGEIGDEIWNLYNIEGLLKAWVNSVSDSGQYSKELTPPKDFPSVPTITYSPVLILRPRKARSLVQTFDKIIKKIQAHGAIPFGIKRTVAIIDDVGEHHPSDGESHLESDKFKELFFPKLSNDEQRRIIDYIRHQQGVLVQGPPGTGKSHTIANLICHFLATGKRVLVTSQTPRALRVLKEMIPEEMAALCVNLLGHDRGSLEELKNSVNGITDRKLQRDMAPLRYTEENGSNNLLIEEYKTQLNELRKRKAKLNRQLCELREKETYEHRICNGAYVGTAQKIAEKVSSERSEYGWLDVLITFEESPPLSDNEAVELVRLCEALSAEDVIESEKQFVPLDKVFTPEQFVLNCQDEREVSARYDTYGEVRGTVTCQRLEAASTEQLSNLKTTLRDFLKRQASVLKHTQPWVQTAVRDIVSERDRRWRHLLKVSAQCFKAIQDEVGRADKRQIIIPDGYEHAVVMADAEALLQHFARGRKLGVPGLRPKVVKKAWYLIKESYVDGRLCDNPKTLRSLLASLNADEQLDRLWDEWSPIAVRSTGSRAAQLHDLKDLCEPLLEALKLHELMRGARKILNVILDVEEPAWHITNEVERYVRIIDAIEAKRFLKETVAPLEKLEAVLAQCLAKPNVNSVVAEMRRAVINRDDTSYCELYIKLELLKKIRADKSHRDQLYSKLRESSAALVVEAFATAPDLVKWQERFMRFAEAWRWAQANTWLNEYISSLNEKDISSDLNHIEDKIGETLGKLAAELAWGFCLNRLTEAQREHLMGWQNAMRRIGKGTGKYAEKNRRDARAHMEECRDAIPAWIMPLYRVAETVDPSIDAFDIVIIDEASQSGPDALLLQFLAEKIIIVGDNEQISPAHVGIPLADVDVLREQYIKDLPNKDALGPESSLFDLAQILFPGRIVLTEHFRCMPEIIQFSNKLCYSGTPLKPLRQYPPSRLKPVVDVVHIANGYRKGTSSMAVNPPEAEAVAAKIKGCCSNFDYKDKTMGVISLLGRNQARLIERLLLEQIGPEEMEKRNILCGDAYSFQGDERDVMFLSMVAASEDGIMRAVTRHQIQQRFNVAASRARDQMWLFHTPTLNDWVNKDCLRYKLLEYCQNPSLPQESLPIEIRKLKVLARTANRVSTPAPEPFGSWFEVDVFLQITDKDYRVIPQFKVAGYFIDLAIEGMTGRLMVECDGDEYHGGIEQFEADQTRQRILERCGCVFWRIRGSQFYLSPEKALEQLWQKLEIHGIAPGGRDVEPKAESLGIFGVESRDSDDGVSTLVKEQGTCQEEQTQASYDSGMLFPQDTQKDRARVISGELEMAIISVLKQCPNSSCTKKSLLSKVCGHLGIRTRGKPRDSLKRKLMHRLSQLKKREIVEEYKAKNVRLRLSTAFDDKETPPYVKESIGNSKSQRQKRGRLERGFRTQEDAYYKPILQSLVEVGGSGKAKDVLDRVGEIMKDILKKPDYEPLSTNPENPRWRNTAQWARNSMVNEGLLKKDSPRGIWELTETGYGWLERLNKLET